MKLAKLLLILVPAVLSGIAIYAQNIPAPAEPPSKPVEVKKDTVAISSVKATNAVLSALKKNEAGDSFNHIIQAMPDKIGNYIQATRRLNVVPQSDALDVCVAAIEGGNSVLSGIDEEIQASFRSVRFPICIRINDYQDLRYSKRIRGAKAELREIRFKASVQVLNSAKGIIQEGKEVSVKRVFAAKTSESWGQKGGSKTEELFGLTADELCRKIAFSLVEFLAPSKVISVGKTKSGSTEITINKGKDTDIKKKQIYEIFEAGEDLYDPETGEYLGKSETLIAKARITSCLAKVSKAKIIWLEEDCEVAVGNIIRLEEKGSEDEE